jgi:NADPH-dependent glutamate synthase beta subunit-like oxidoreductase
MKGVCLLEQFREELDFEEIIPLFSKEQAKKESERCLYCYDAPCKKGCPADVDVPHFIQAIRSGNLKRAAKIINRSNPFGGVCGRVCPVERLCQENCTAQFLSGMPIEINRLQAFATEYGNFTPEPAEATREQKVAVIGAGPAGLACARELTRNGYSVTVFESKEQAGGMVAFGVPEYRCSHEVTAREVEIIEKEGVEIRTKTPFSKDVSKLFEEGYDAVFVAIGLTKTVRPDLPGLDLQGVYMGLDFLNRIGSGDPPPVGKKVVTVGGGDTALDCARSALRLGAEESTLLYRRSFTELPATQAEIEETLDEDVVFRTLTLPVALIGDGDNILRAVEVVSMKLGPADSSGRRKPKLIQESAYRLPCNTIIFATGFEPSKLLLKLLPDVQFDGVYPVVNPKTMQTSMEGVFCGGDVSNGGATVVEAVKEGKLAAKGIIEYLEEKFGKITEVEPPVVEAVPDETETEPVKAAVGTGELSGESEVMPTGTGELTEVSIEEPTEAPTGIEPEEDEIDTEELSESQQEELEQKSKSDGDGIQVVELPEDIVEETVIQEEIVIQEFTPVEEVDSQKEIYLEEEVVSEQYVEAISQEPEPEFTPEPQKIEEQEEIQQFEQPVSVVVSGQEEAVEEIPEMISDQIIEEPTEEQSSEVSEVYEEVAEPESAYISEDVEEPETQEAPVTEYEQSVEPEITEISQPVELIEETVTEETITEETVVEKPSVELTETVEPVFISEEPMVTTEEPVMEAMEADETFQTGTGELVLDADRISRKRKKLKKKWRKKLAEKFR